MQITWSPVVYLTWIRTGGQQFDIIDGYVAVVTASHHPLKYNLEFDVQW